MFAIPTPISRDYHEDLKQIHNELSRINSNMPKKSAFQEELDSLRDTVLRQEEIIKGLQNKASSLLSLNEELLRYIDGIEAVKNSGGVKVAFQPLSDPMKPQVLRIKRVTIPEVNLAILE